MVPEERYRSTFARHRCPGLRLLASTASRFVAAVAAQAERTRSCDDPTAVAAATAVAALAAPGAVAAAAVAEAEAVLSVVVAVAVARIAGAVAGVVAEAAEVLVAAAIRGDS